MTSEVPARRDLDELEVQVAAGEIDRKTADLLRATYQAELGEKVNTPTGLSRPRIWGGVVLVGSLVLILYLASQAIEPRLPEPTAGTFDPAAFSNETLEAVIAANAEHPLINGMRLALANRYFEERNYQAALPHYQEVLSAEPSPEQEAEALARVGWMVFDGNGEVELATELLDRALTTQPDLSFAKFLKAQVRWCGAGEAALAVELFDEILADPDLPGEVRSQVEEARAGAAAGEPCR